MVRWGLHGIGSEVVKGKKELVLRGRGLLRERGFSTVYYSFIMYPCIIIRGGGSLYLEMSKHGQMG